jgi:acid phosphatase (class A)
MSYSALSRRSLLLCAVLAIFAPAGLQAAGPYLGTFDPFSLLPPPPAAHGTEDLADRDEAYQVYLKRTPAEVSLAKAEHKVTFAAFSKAAGCDLKAGRYPKLDAIFLEVDAETKRVVDLAKAHWGRKRPFLDDPDRFPSPADPEKSAGYPSGHATRGIAFAMILSEIFPQRRDQIFDKGRLIGWTRVEAGVHTPLDIYAGRVLGQALGRAFLASPALQEDLAAARAEVAAAR